MQQKVAIARPATSPVLLLLDEPTTGLDPRSKLDVQRFVRELREGHDATILLCTHDMAEAAALCDRVAILEKGRLAARQRRRVEAAVWSEIGAAEPTLEEHFHPPDRSVARGR